MFEFFFFQAGMGNQCCSGDDNPGQQVTHSQVKAALPDDDAPAVAAPKASGVTTEDDPPAAPPPKRVSEVAESAPEQVAEPVAAQSTPEPTPEVKDAKVLLVKFKTPDGSIKDVEFKKRPLGLDFNKTNPIEMKRIAAGSEGDRLGVKSGWSVHGVDGEDVTKKEFDYTYNMLRKISSQLPE